MTEQARAIKEMTVAARDVAKQIGLIARSNREHMNLSAGIAGSLGEAQRVTQRNGQGAQETLRHATGLIEHAQSLNAIAENVAYNGTRGKRTGKKKSKK